MTLNETPLEYGGPIDPPMLNQETDALYLALREGGPLPGRQKPAPHFLAQDLRVIAERLECDHQVARLRRHGVSEPFGPPLSAAACRAGWGDRRDTDPGGLGLHAVAACVTLYWRDDADTVDKDRTAQVNAAAAVRVADRLDSGMFPAEAIRRTLSQCERKAYTEGDVRRLESNAT